jgi:putative Mn2+ efflux pump MntP
MFDKVLDYFKGSAESLNENKYFIGFTMILLNIGARFIIDELDDDTRSMISNKVVRRFFVFCSFFMATKDVFIATLLTIVFVIILNEFLGKEEEEDSKKKPKGGSFNKQELDKTIHKLKGIQATM